MPKRPLVCLAAATSLALASEVQAQTHFTSDAGSEDARSDQIRTGGKARNFAQSHTRPRKSRRASDFADRIKAIVRDRGAELCARYGSDPDCIEEIEVCFSMLDKDDDLMKVCLSMAPEGRGPKVTERIRLRR